MRRTIKALFFISTLASYLHASPLKSDEHVMFLPSIAYIENQQLHVEVNLWIYEKEARRGFDTILKTYLGIKSSQLSPTEKAYFAQQTALFKVDSERNKALTVRFPNGEVRELAKTDRSGRSSNLFSFNADQVKYLISPNQTVTFYLDTHPDQQGSALFSENKGYLIISDIDDTIKDSAVLDTKTLLRNTFLYPPKVAPNMPERFAKLKQELPDPLFAYVSSSPIQLLPTLTQFIDDHYPQGILKLRQSTAWDEVIASKAESIEHKKSSITQFLDAYPMKKVVLLGDSGENDPEIYWDIYEQYGDRIEKIYIRNVTNQSPSDARYSQFPTSIFTIIEP